MSDAIESTCPRCGAVLPSINGLCAMCLARGALDHGTGWLMQSTTSLSQSANELVIDGWRIIGTLGAGGMGRVYHAESEADGTQAAIKVLDQRWSDDPAMVARFQNEARLLQSLDHPNIVRLIESTETDDGRLCLVTELVQGCDLGRLLRAEKLAHERAFAIFDKVCAAVEHAHEHGLIHRDLKPSNILVGRDGEVKLADFGLAREVHEANEVSVIGGLTATTDQFGTAYYIAPERMLSTAPPAPTMDVYSLGVLLYHLLTGQMPLGNYTAVSVLTGLPRELDAIIARALDADASKRTPQVSELHGKAMQLWRDHSAGTLRSRKLRRIISIAAGLLLITGGAIGGAWWQNERMKPKPIVFPDPAKATQSQPWTNSLDMKFVPVPGTKVLFSIYETRRREADAFIQVSMNALDIPWLEGESARILEQFNRSLWNLQGDDGEWTNFSYKEPGWPVTPEHPVFFVSGIDAHRMCSWLTWKERKEGRLKANQRYRLPTTEEWLAACGGADAAPRSGNVAGPEAREGLWPKHMPTFDTSDPFPRTAPTGSFPVELHGLYDISGNVTEWVCDSSADPYLMSPQELRQSFHVRGPAFNDGRPEAVSFSHVRPTFPNKRLVNIGFRMVLEWQEGLSSSPQSPDHAPPGTAGSEPRDQ